MFCLQVSLTEYETFFFCVDFSSVCGLNIGAPSIIKMQGVLPVGPVMKLNFIVSETELTTSGVSCKHGNELLG